MLVNPDDHVLLVQEFESKPHFGKHAGMFSIPMETCRPGEPDAVALQRLITEELPGFSAKVYVEHERLGVYRIVPKVWVALYRATIEDADLLRTSTQAVGVGNHEWREPTSAVRLWLRQGAREMLCDYVAGRKGVVCSNCAPVSATPIVQPSFLPRESERLPRR